MAVKNVLRPCRLFPVGTLMDDDLESDSIEIQWQDDVSIQLSWDGDPDGDFTVQASLDQTNWVDVPLSSTPTASGAPDTAVINMQLLSFPYVRVLYSSNSGSGTLDAFISAKEV